MDEHDWWWEVPPHIDTQGFDFLWAPPLDDPPYIHQFGTQWQKTGGPRLVVPGATERKYWDSPRVIRTPHRDGWHIPDGVQLVDWDWSWHPDDTETGINWAFGDGQRWSFTYRTSDSPHYRLVDHPRARITYQPLDVFYLSCGEPCEEEHWQIILDRCPRAPVWIRGVAGRERAIAEAARRSTTPYFLLIPARVRVDSRFPWDFQPTHRYRDQHYIFYVDNPTTGIAYGHGAPVCYNRDLVLATREWGLDFTTSAPHTVIPTTVGTTPADLPPQVAWRVAFREAVKLRCDTTDEGAARLRAWLTPADRGPAGQWSARGAQDGVDYWVAVGGRHDLLMRTFDTRWVDDLWRDKYGGGNYGR